MVTIAHIVEKVVREQPLLEDAILRDIVSYAKAAEYVKPDVEKELRKPVKHGAIVMALTRLSEKLQESGKETFGNEHLSGIEMSLRSDMMEITILKSQKSFDAIRKLYGIVDFSSGDVLNVIQGNHEITIVASKKYEKRLDEELRFEKVTNRIRALSSLSIKFPKKFVETPGFFSLVTRHLAWHGVNIIEIVSTYTELTLVLKDEEVTKAYGVLQELFKKQERRR